MSITTHQNPAQCIGSEVLLLLGERGSMAREAAVSAVIERLELVRSWEYDEISEFDREYRHQKQRVEREVHDLVTAGAVLWSADDSIRL